MKRSIYFRALEPSDVPLIYKWMNDQEMMKDAVGMSRPWSMRDCVDWVESRTKHNPFNYWFAICLNDSSNKMIGYTGVNNIHFVNSSATCDAIVIGEKEYRDGITWLETNILIREFVFEKLNLNRYYGRFSETQQTTSMANKLFFATVEGVSRQAIWGNGKFHDVINVSLLREEYMMHKECGDFEISALIKRFRRILKKAEYR